MCDMRCASRPKRQALQRMRSPRSHQLCLRVRITIFIRNLLGMPLHQSKYWSRVLRRAQMPLVQPTWWLPCKVVCKAGVNEGLEKRFKAVGEVTIRRNEILSCNMCHVSLYFSQDYVLSCNNKSAQIYDHS